jgi:hypothetical protein
MSVTDASAFKNVFTFLSDDVNYERTVAAKQHNCKLQLRIWLPSFFSTVVCLHSEAISVVGGSEARPN